MLSTTAFFPMLILAALVLGGVAMVYFAARMRRSGRPWGWPVLVLALLVLLGLNVWHERTAVQQHVSILGPVAQPDVDQLWDQMNKLRIEVAPNQPPRRGVPNPAQPSANAAGISPETAKLLADMVVQVDALSHQLAEVAKEVAKSSRSASDTMPQSATAEATADGGSATPVRPLSVSLALKVADAAMTVAKKNAASTSVTANAADAAVAVEAPSRNVAAEPTTQGSQSPGPTEPAVRSVAAETPAEPRPDWVDDPPRRVGNIWREVIAAGEYETDDECIRAANVYLLLATYDRVMQLTDATQVAPRTRPSLLLQPRDVLADGRYLIKDGRPVDSRLSMLAQMGVGIDYIRREIVPADGQYYQTVQRSFGPMKTLYVLLEFSPSVDHELRQRWEGYERTERFTVVGGVAGLVVGVVGLAFGLLKVDTWTKGYYTKRLFLGVPAVIIGLVALLALLVGP